jgi:hypothetical protein
MHTSILMAALSGFALAADPEGPSWLTDYATATRQGANSKKPLAVFLGSGVDGWKKMSQEGALPVEAKRVLNANFICVHIDTSTAKGKSLARAFDIPEGLGIVISDRSAQLQAFRHEGDLTNAALVRYLKRYGDPSHVVHYTESNPPEHGYSGYSGYGNVGGAAFCPS